MRRLLDTNICIAFLNGTDEGIRERISAGRPSDFAICSVVKAELLYGARKSRRVEANLARLEAFFTPLESLPFDDEAAMHYGVIRAQLEAAGTPIGSNDLLIASIALATGSIVITRNTSEFRRVAALRVESW